MLDVCGGEMDIAPSEYEQSWSVTFDGLWRRANYGWSVSPIQGAVSSRSEEWNEVLIRGGWVSVLWTTRIFGRHRRYNSQDTVCNLPIFTVVTYDI
jgi:hypothetical protein